MQGRLIIWHNVLDDVEGFRNWVQREHIPERVSIPGFRRCRRYRSSGGGPSELNIYDTDDPEVLFSKNYKDRLNNPTEWTRRAMPLCAPSFCRNATVVESAYGQTGGAVAILTPPSVPKLVTLTKLVDGVGVVGFEVCRVIDEASDLATVERDLRGAPDETVEWILLLEGTDEAALRRAAASLGSNMNLVNVFQLHLLYEK
jgi:hypothetical protein